MKEIITCQVAVLLPKKNIHNYQENRYSFKGLNPSSPSAKQIQTFFLHIHQNSASQQDKCRKQDANPASKADVRQIGKM